MASVMLLPDEARHTLISVDVNGKTSMITAIAQTIGSAANCPYVGMLRIECIRPSGLTVPIWRVGREV